MIESLRKWSFVLEVEMRSLAFRVTLIGLASASQVALAQDLRPFENYSVHLGGIDGSVYTAETPTGSRLVATLSGGPEGTPVRFVTDLVPGQSATVSVPRGPGEAAMEVTFTRQGGRVVVTDAQTLVGSIR